MKIGILKEINPIENRVAMTPEIAKLFIKQGFFLYIEENAGLKAGFTNESYTEVGVEVVSRKQVLEQNIVLKVSAPLAEEVLEFKSSTKLICHLSALMNNTIINALSKQSVEAYALELMPRISRAQSMDILSSQSNLSGYMAVIYAMYHSNLIFPMMMTAAGTMAPAKVTILGIGVAGLQAIATAKRSGAVVSAYDVRAETKEQAESLGAKFLVVDDSIFSQEKSVYAQEVTEEYKIKQQQVLKEHLSKQDIVITTALLQGKKSPILINEEILSVMKKGSLIIDLAAENGGNVEGSVFNQISDVNGVKVVGIPVIQSVAKQASNLFAKNIYNFLLPHVNKQNNELSMDYNDTTVIGTLVTKDGQLTPEFISKKTGA